MRIKKTVLRCLALAVMTVLAAGLLAGCNIMSSVTFKVDTGDNVMITANGGYTMSPEVPFSVTKSREVIAQGTFISAEQYKTYIETFDASAKKLDSGARDDVEYSSYTVDGESGTEYDYIIMIRGSQTGVLLGSLKTQEEADAAFAALIFEVN